jgi:hypothetical protein
VSNDLIFPLVTTSTELNVANTAGSANNVTIRIFAADGTELAAAQSRSVAVNGVLQIQASALFPGVNLDNARYIRVAGAAGLTGTAVINGFLVNEWGVTNAVPASSVATEANFPHVVSGVGGGGNYTTVVGVTSLSSAPQTVTLAFTPEAGGAATTVQKQIAANGSLRDTVQNIFSFSSSTFQNGWIKVTGTSITAFVAYADSVAGGLAVVPVQTTPRTTLMFAHIADLPPWYTGLALLNTGQTSATVSVYAMNPNGSLIAGADNVATAKFTLNAGAKTAKLLSELIPQTQQRTSDGGFIFVSSTQPLYGLELFFLRNLRILANVAAGSGAGFTPPAPPPPGQLTLTSISPTKAAIGATLTAAGTGFNANAASNNVVFTAASGTVSAQAFAATSTSLSVTIPSGAITGPVYVQVGGPNSASKILEVLATATSLLPASTVTVNGSATTSSVDIYVPPPLGTLNATIIGIGDPGTSIPASSSSVDVSRGTTKQLLLGGPVGLSAANGSTVTITGDGITVGTPAFSQNNQLLFLFVNITVSASATPGPRNVIVTNSNLDTSVMSGGLFVR